ncbi:hypothetical protein B9Z55_012356 [Caenorhabditis nigoni]|uniref:Uncharacterized protein n=1 Tax=Caenorhabditis nigoni TaxID=1611254 RepID=A0A2G5TXW1_9PELO|nr:hypothetical protein B9Z55_012356 [Caenorhabditis nigoni]
MRWLLLLALLILPSLSNSERYEELKPVTTFHAGHPLERMVTAMWCRNDIHLPDIQDVIAPIREALLTKCGRFFEKFEFPTFLLEKLNLKNTTFLHFSPIFELYS